MGANWRKALIGNLVIANRRSAVTAGFPRIASAAKSAAIAQASCDGVAGETDGGKRHRIREFVGRFVCKHEWENQNAYSR